MDSANMATHGSGCQAQTAAGKPCAAQPLKGRATCLAHSDANTRESVGFVANNGRAGRPASPRAVDLVRERVEAEAEAVLAPLWGALEATTEKGGQTIPDHRARLAAASEILDRAYGKPKQATEISAADGYLPIELLAELLGRVLRGLDVFDDPRAPEVVRTELLRYEAARDQATE